MGCFYDLGVMQKGFRGLGVLLRGLGLKEGRFKHEASALQAWPRPSCESSARASTARRCSWLLGADVQRTAPLGNAHGNEHP